MSLLKLYGTELKKLRLLKGLSLETVAKEVNLTPQQVARTEEGLRDISLENLKKYAELYGVNTSDITDTITTNKTPDALEGIKDLIDLFYANKSLYDKTYSITGECFGCCHFRENCGYYTDCANASEEEAFIEHCVGCCCGDGAECNLGEGCNNYEETPVMG